MRSVSEEGKGRTNKGRTDQLVSAKSTEELREKGHH